MQCYSHPVLPETSIEFLSASKDATINSKIIANPHDTFDDGRSAGCCCDSWVHGSEVSAQVTLQLTAPGTGHTPLTRPRAGHRRPVAAATRRRGREFSEAFILTRDADG